MKNFAGLWRMIFVRLIQGERYRYFLMQFMLSLWEMHPDIRYQVFWKDFTENDIYSKLLNGKLQANLGYIYENARIMREILLYTKDYQKDGSLECVPIMWAQFI